MIVHTMSNISYCMCLVIALHLIYSKTIHVYFPSIQPCAADTYYGTANYYNNSVAP